MINFRSLFRKVLPSGSKKTLQKLMLGYHSYAPSFSSAGEDMILRHLIGAEKRNGFYVDVGAFHPVNSSNTYYFYLNGWRGINIDACPGSMTEFNKVRPRDTNLEAGVSDVNDELTYYFIDKNSSMNSFSKEFLIEIGMHESVKEEIKVPVYKLSQILDEHLPAGQTIDFLSVDVEGFDYNVLVSNDWDKYRARIVVVEDSYKDEGCSRVLDLLKSKDYEVCVKNVIILNKIAEYFLIDKKADFTH
ncbi:MAG: FkbM family methyltransferase [Pyrinomonadaceae bacterium]